MNTNPNNTNPNMSAAAVRAKEEYLFEAGAKAARGALEPCTIEVNGRHFLITGEGTREVVTPDPEPSRFPRPIELFSLCGLIDYIKADPDHIFSNEGYTHIVRVLNEREVQILTPITGEGKDRGIIASCTAHTPSIMFGRYQPGENFQVMMQTSFHRDANVDLILKITGSLKKEQALQTADDGVSQRVAINTGVVSSADVTIKNPVELQPMRTFCEIEQPISPFVLRFNEDAEVALFEGDGNAWKTEAVARIGAFLRANLVDCNVVVLA